MVSVLTLVFAFRSSAALAFAYGMAVTGTITITTILFFYVARRTWRAPGWLLVAGGAVLVGIDLLFVAANLTKFVHGGWLPLAIALVAFTVMTTWQQGRTSGDRAPQCDGRQAERLRQRVAVGETARQHRRRNRGVPQPRSPPPRWRSGRTSSTTTSGIGMSWSLLWTSRRSRECRSSGGRRSTIWVMSGMASRMSPCASATPSRPTSPGPWRASTRRAPRVVSTWRTPRISYRGSRCTPGASRVGCRCGASDCSSRLPISPPTRGSSSTFPATGSCCWLEHRGLRQRSGAAAAIPAARQLSGPLPAAQRAAREPVGSFSFSAAGVAGVAAASAGPSSWTWRLSVLSALASAFSTSATQRSSNTATIAEVSGGRVSRSALIACLVTWSTTAPVPAPWPRPPRPPAVMAGRSGRSERRRRWRRPRRRLRCRRPYRCP